jgi:hypothetical protein
VSALTQARDNGAVKLRPATCVDDAALERLAQLDSARVPAGRLLVAESAGELRAAISLETGHAIANPFVPSAHIVDALRAHAAGENGSAPRWKLERASRARLAI